MTISNICQLHMCTSCNNLIRQTDRRKGRPRPTSSGAQRRSAARRAVQSVLLRPRPGQGRERERDGKRRNSRRPRQARLLRSRSPTYYFSVGRCRRRCPLGSGRISVRNLDLTLWKAFIAAPLHKGQRFAEHGLLEESVGEQRVGKYVLIAF